MEDNDTTKAARYTPEPDVWWGDEGIDALTWADSPSLEELATTHEPNCGQLSPHSSNDTREEAAHV
jgi:hypothetical protein